MSTRGRKWVKVDQSDPNRGRYDPLRATQKSSHDIEERPVVTKEDSEATRAELAELRRRMTRKAG